MNLYRSAALVRASFVFASLVPAIVGVAPAAETPPADARHVPMPLELAREKALAFAAAATGSPADEPPEAVRALWQNVEPGVPARGVHDLVLRSFAESDPVTKDLLATFDPRRPLREPPDLVPVTERSNDPFYRTNLRIEVARALVDARLFDEALTLYDDIDLAEAVDPATALFYRAVCEHQLLMKDEGLASLTALLDRTDVVPESYIAVARLMQAELEALSADSLDEIAGLMRDVERRLGLARGGQRVQKREDEIVAKLDEMIKKIEQQMSQSSSSNGSSGGNSNGSSNPADDSVVKGATAPGNVDPKDIRRQGDWGDLPPREREQAKNEIEKAFPANYSRLINEYFLKRTRTGSPSGE